MKVGDKVKTKEGGKIGIIVKVDDNNCYRVNYKDFDFGDNFDNWGYHYESNLELLKKELKDVEFGDMITDGTKFRYIFGRINDAVFASGWCRTEEEAKFSVSGGFSLPEFLRNVGDSKFVEESDDVDVTVDGKTTTISRKSAEALNLI